MAKINIARFPRCAMYAYLMSWPTMAHSALLEHTDQVCKASVVHILADLSMLTSMAVSGCTLH